MQGTTHDPIDSLTYIISNNTLDFRAGLSPLQITAPDMAIVPFKMAQALNLNPGDSFRYIPE
jgi:arginine/ornithine N-succinyltransferase beta subunit